MRDGPRPPTSKGFLRLLAGLLALASVFVFAVSAASLVTSASLKDDKARLTRPQIAVQVDVVSVPVTVTDSHGEFVGGLAQRNFRLRVDGAERSIDYFSAEEDPAEALLLLESGPAVYLLGREHVLAATKLIEDLSPGDRVAISTYSDALSPLLAFTADKGQAIAAIRGANFWVGMAQLNFYDSLGAALDWPASARGKHAIVLLTTGLDDSGAGHWEKLLAKLQSSNVMLIPVALGGQLRDVSGGASRSRRKDSAAPGSASFAASNEALKALAAETGGYAFFPRSDADFDSAYRRIALLLRHEYSIGFALTANEGAGGGHYHNISVELIDDSGRPFDGKDGRRAYRLNARHGFLAPAP